MSLNRGFGTTLVDTPYMLMADRQLGASVVTCLILHPDLAPRLHHTDFFPDNMGVNLTCFYYAQA